MIFNSNGLPAMAAAVVVGAGPAMAIVGQFVSV
jgi:hypothetical protein